jgi:hypothetical protein
MCYLEAQENQENAAFADKKKRPTKHTPGVGESARFTSIFLASSFLCSQAESTPAHTQVTPAVSLLTKT